VDVNVMARRALKDEMPGMVLRGVTRAIAKGVMQNELQKRGGLVGGLIGAVASAAPRWPMTACGACCPAVSTSPVATCLRVSTSSQ
jgi:hypothetical protein